MDIAWTPWRYAYIAEETPARAGVPKALSAWQGDLGCVFCNMFAAVRFAVENGMSQQEADRAAGIVYRQYAVCVVLNAYPYASGHCMVTPLEHLPTLHQLPEETAEEMVRIAQRVDEALYSVYKPDGVNMGINEGKAAGAGVAGHLHLHCLPRWIGDTNFMTTTAETRVLPETLDVTWQRLHDALKDEDISEGLARWAKESAEKKGPG